MKYRAEIDGLRALAVVPVILFHAGFELFSGGFVGVDVFFVISGYLITTILIDDIENKRFSLISFYERRARRILPALFLVMFICIPFAWMWMLPDQMKDFSRSLASVSLFASNILFWRESGYFAAAAEEKPLLHTWSLAVEEQYYLLFPIFLFFVWRFGKSRVFWMIAFLAVISLAVSEWGWRTNPTANFYLAHARAWELFAGSLAAFVVQKYGVQKNNTLSLIGIVAIIYAIFAFDENTPFPSVYALLPVIGVVLLVVFADKQTYAARLLGSKFFVGIGLISYSTYLWHQPLFAFARIRSLNEPSLWLMGALGLGSVFLAILSWKYIEQPFRNKQKVSKNDIFVSSGASIFAFVALGLFGYSNNGFENRFVVEIFPDWRDSSDCLVGNNAAQEKLNSVVKSCFAETTSNFILIGDSHAKSLSLELRAEVRRYGGELVTFLVNGCLPVPGTSRLPLHKECVLAKETFWNAAKKTDATIVFSSRWRLNLEGPRYNNEEGGVEYGKSGKNFVVNDNSADIFDYTFNQLAELAKDNEVVVISQIPEAGWNVPDRLAKLLKFGSAATPEMSTSYDVYLERNKRVIDLMQRLEAVDGVTLVRTEEIVCNVDDRRCANTLNGKALYRDDDHPSPLLSKFIANKFGSLILSR